MNVPLRTILQETRVDSRMYGLQKTIFDVVFYDT